MSNTTKVNVLAIAPELSTGISDAQWTLVLSDVASDIDLQTFGSKQEVAQRYLVAHRLTLLKSSNSGDAFTVGAITSKSVGDVSISYAASGGKEQASTKYEAEFNKIKSKLLFGFKNHPCL